jgi:TRAP-type C4-dicarboxylate transport system permease small subunit
MKEKFFLVLKIRRQYMKRIIDCVLNIDKLMYIIASIILACMVIITLFDVVLRNFGHPVTGSVEIIQYGGLLVFSLSVPYATYLGAQVIVDILTEKLNNKNQKKLSYITRLTGIAIFLFIACNSFKYGWDVRKTCECTPYFRIPLYPFAFIVSLTFIFQSFTIFLDLIKKITGEKNE